ncbi:hypothetical protein ACFYUV_38445 [Nonomuraea sp. NPDC003560]|uniref:hypothetical protein n=1 Tax=Nonomuraea sp. NPDC003560 TaxID=3364341 RepID=UPI0036BA7845
MKDKYIPADMLEWSAAVLPHLISWESAGVMLIALVVGGIFRLLAEWQRRLTLVALVERAPGGTVVVQERGLGGPAMWVQVGHGPRAISPPQLPPGR